MFNKHDRVRHIDPKLDIKYGIMEIWEIKNDFATCRHGGDFLDFKLDTFPLTDLKFADN